MSRAGTTVIALGVALAGCAGPAPPSQTHATEASGGPRAAPRESGFAPCALLDASSVTEVLNETIASTSEHLSFFTVGGFRDCVFFLHEHGVVLLSVRQSATSPAEADALVELLAEEFSGAQVESGLVGSVPATELAYCEPPRCYSSLAFLVDPYFVVITIPRGAGDFGDAGVLGQRVIDRLIGG